MRKTCLTLLLVFIAWSCSKSDDQLLSNSTKTPNQFQPLTFGSYWVYEYFKVDTNGVTEKLNQADTVFITKDTVINGNIYAVFVGTDFWSSEWRVLSKMRDSLGYLVDEKGTIHFSSFNFTDTLLSGWNIDLDGDTLSQYASKMVDSVFMISIPTGDFECLNFRTTYTSDQFPPGMETRNQDNYYAENIGLVQSNFFYSAGTDVIMRKLVYYSIAD